MNEVRDEEYKQICLSCCPVMKLSVDWAYSRLYLSDCVTFHTKLTNALVAELEESVFPNIGHDPQSLEGHAMSTIFLKTHFNIIFLSPVIPRLTKIIRSGITFVSRILR